MTIKHDVREKTFRALADGRELGHLEYQFGTKGSAKAVDFYHTFTLPEAQGKGIAAKMVEVGLQWAKESDYAIIVSCSYVSAFMQRNPQWRSSL